MDKVRVSFTITEKPPAISENAYPAATTEDVSFTAVPVQRPYPRSDIPKYLPIIGNKTTISTSNINVADMAYAISLSSASITGAMDAMAEPPHIPVPSDIN